MIFITSLLLLLPFSFGLFIPHDNHLTPRAVSFRQVIEYIDAHNAIRTQHGAQNLTWSWELADMAQVWADSCAFTSTGGILSDKPYGENMVAATGDFPVPTAVQTFISDESAYDPASPVYNHFTQVVWRNTTELGCGLAKCDSIFTPSKGQATFHVCFYNPPGNVVGEAQDNVQM
ncbi:PR-1 protein [Dendrothele bispora CBS 962.96]|uniref:PR-1 protein n=1 Tax=Dendrothele bispora (strain CBS 962.96) TaxID=1314807 RepID=A0A4S8MYC1_DENBC|nr:PR-1 protein [Dendrothele bispora CBS 962.96]